MIAHVHGRGDTSVSVKMTGGGFLQVSITSESTTVKQSNHITEFFLKDYCLQVKKKDYSFLNYLFISILHVCVYTHICMHTD